MNNDRRRGSVAPRLTPIAAVLATMLGTAPAWAQAPQTPEEKAAAEKAAAAEKSRNEASGGLDRVIVTATSLRRTKLRSSVSVTDIDQDQIKDSGARTEAEVLLLIPGIRTESTAGPAGNANITVRGLPISSGGSKYVQLQEDGLPTVQFGDMNFSNNDYWIRFDNSVDSIQTLRGGSSSVFASHAPGAVINYISRTGKDAGGSVGITRGLNYGETRGDMNYGGALGSGLYFHVGGYYREGESTRHYGSRALEGYQLKGNMTKEFNGGKGYFRVNFKVLDEHAPTTPQTFALATQNGTDVGGFRNLTNFSGSRDSQYSIYNSSVPGIDPLTRTRTTTSLADGISVDSKSLGFEFRNELANGFTVENKFRKSWNSGAFQAQFWNVRTLDNYVGTSGNEVRYFNGPLAGQVATNANLATGLVSDGAAINTQTPDMGNLVNDLSVSKQFKFDATTIDLRGGLFRSTQNVVQRWAISERLVEVGRNGAVLDAFSPTGTALTTAGLSGYNNQWGCCARDVDAQFTTTAPYVSANAAFGPVDLEAGLRRETFLATGTYAAGSSQAFDVDGNGTVTGAENNTYLINPNAPRSNVNYKVSYTNHSVGANYRVTNDLSVFVRQSKGTRAISDRLLFSPNIDTVTGALTSRQAALAPVSQAELGTKFRGNAAGVSYSIAATYFKSKTDEFDFDQTRQDNPALPNYAGPKLNQLGYKADGIELETGAQVGGFGIGVNAVYSKETITKDAGGSAVDALNPTGPRRSQVGKTSGGVPRWRYTIAPRYTWGGLTLGAGIRGQSWVYTGNDNVNKIKGHFIATAFGGYDFGNGIVAGLNINNLFDKVYPASGGGFVGGSTSVFGAGIQTGRTISATVKYNF
jgi:outer membrane receptor protein involved in Fe transport